jgi:hypothetical protein
VSEIKFKFICLCLFVKAFFVIKEEFVYEIKKMCENNLAYEIETAKTLCKIFLASAKQNVNKLSAYIRKLKELRDPKDILDDKEQRLFKNLQKLKDAQLHLINEIEQQKFIIKNFLIK